MFLAGLIFISGVSISLVAAYFSIVGLATMFPGSKEAIIIMGAALEVGKLIAAVWLHKNWHNAFGFLRYYLLSAVIILSIITSMGIFGFLSKSHVEHGASIEKEQAIISQIEHKIVRKQEFIAQRNELISSLKSSSTNLKEDSNTIINRLDERIKSLKEEEKSLISIQDNIILKIESKEEVLNEALKNSKKSTGLFSSNTYNSTLLSQQEDRDKIEQDKQSALKKIEDIKLEFNTKIEAVRGKIDEAQQVSKPTVSSDPKIESYRLDVEKAYEEINNLESEKFEYGSALRALEVEIGPIKYIVGALQEWVGFNVGTEQAIRIIIVVLIFVFDPLAILLLIAATITYSASKEEDLPPEVKEIRNKLLEELEEYLNDGGLADHFIERAKK
jgi:predicted  nucleic acid-binding Zn-ribbon protein